MVKFTNINCSNPQTGTRGQNASVHLPVYQLHVCLESSQHKLGLMTQVERSFEVLLMHEQKMSLMILYVRLDTY